jgi:cytosol alanyl aminopeptidase
MLTSAFGANLSDPQWCRGVLAQVIVGFNGCVLARTAPAQWENYEMRRYRVPAVLAFCLTSFFAIEAAAQVPKLRLAEVQNVAPTRYDAELTLDPGKPEFSGSIRVGLDIQKPLTTLWLNATNLHIGEASLTAGGKTWPAMASMSGDDFVAFHFASAIPAGAAELWVRYTGNVLQKDTSGVFRLDDLGNSYIFTQFESIEARRAFPCFDEPSYKVRWQLTLRVPAQDKAVSNTPLERQTAAGGQIAYVFQQTEPLPSYLIAFGVGPFEFVDGGTAGQNHVPVRIVVPKGRAEEAEYAAEVTATIITRLENYFGIPFPYEKSDQVAIPAVFGAMENAGMVTYQQSWLLAKPATDSIARQRRYAWVAAHELAHQWFGDLVTMAWWNDLWLNEAFATWMQQKLLAEWKPEWKTSLDDVDSLLAGERADSLTSARKIRQEIVSKGDIDNAADSITYEKGAAVIGMFERWLGSDPFRKGVQSYLERYRFGNASAADFLDSLSAASKQDIKPAFSTFLDQTGVPLVSIGLDCTGKAPVLHLAQSRYLPLGSRPPAEQLWSVPLSIRYSGGSARMLLTQRKADWRLDSQTCPAWVEANADGRGYYRVDYQSGLLAALISGDGTKTLTDAERMELMGNVRALAAAGKAPEAEALRLAERLHDDSERHIVSGTLAIDLGIEQNLVPENLMANYGRYLLKNYLTRARDLGWISRPGESDDVRLLRPSLVSAVATYGGDQQLANEARRLTESWLKDRTAVPPEVVAAILNTAAYSGDAALHAQLLSELEKTQDQREQQQLLAALAGFRDPKLLQKGLDELLAGRLPIKNDFRLLLASGNTSRGTRKLAFNYLKAHFDQLMAGNPSVQGFSLGVMLPGIGGSFCDAASRQELVAFFNPLTKRYDGSQHTLDETLEKIDQCIALIRAQQPSVEGFLKSY